MTHPVLPLFVQHFVHVHRRRTDGANRNSPDSLTGLCLFSIDGVGCKRTEMTGLTVRLGSYSGFNFHDYLPRQLFYWGLLFCDPHHKIKYTLITQKLIPD